MAVPTSIMDAEPRRFSITGVTDSLDGTEAPPGSCTSLADIIPDLSTKNMWTPRPAAFKVANINNIEVNGGNVTIFKIIGNVAYGLYTSFSVPFPFVDKPFAFNLLTGAFLTVTITSAIYPVTQTPTGDYPSFPPTMDLVGVFLVVTHAGFPGGASGYFGWFDITNPLSPAWNVGNTAAGSAFSFSGTTGNPWWVAQFGQRAYFGVNPPNGQPSTVATDVLTLKVTNAGQVLTYGDNQTLTAGVPMPLSNQLGGIVQSLMVFKGTSNIYQVTGDFAGSTWAVNTLNLATGTLSPRAIVRTPVGLTFISPQGVRIIDKDANVSEPIGIAGSGVVVPFVTQLFPSRAVGACDGVTLRICFVSGTNGGNNVYSEYWYNIPRKSWSGPHSFAIQSEDVWQGTFIVSPTSYNSVIGALFQSDTIPNATSVYVEQGIQMTYTIQTSQLPDNYKMAQSELSEMQLVAGSAASATMTVKLLDTNGSTINTANSLVVNASGSSPGVYPYRVDFPAQSVFNRAAISVTGNSGAGLKIGNLWMRIKTLRYIISGQTPST